MPDSRALGFGGLCARLEPEASEGRIVDNGVIRCSVPLSEAQTSENWRWSYKGKNLGVSTSDLAIPDFKLEGEYIVIGRK